MTARPVLLAAGGTGGHLFPAESLAIALAARGYAVELATDERAIRYGGEFPARAIHTIASATPRGGSLLAKGLAAATLGWGTLSALALLARLKPLCVVGFGGYPTVPPLMAASLLRIPCLLHDQNAVLGKANRFLAGRVDAIGSGFPKLGGVPARLRGLVTCTGNPVRPAVIEASRIPYPDFADGRFRLLVTGGSQGARVMSDVVPPAVALLDAAQRARLTIVQQARGEDEARVREAYGRLGVAAEVAPFFRDLPARIAQAHLVIARSGASTVSELSVIGRPAVLVPFPFALDQDQTANAAHLAQTGAVEVVEQPKFTPEWLAGALAQALEDPEGLTRRAEAAKSAGVPDAAGRLADLVTEVIGRSKTAG
jgi:UDP-N-acetylglucosamine--N-acetylmuramyl-(pentapeptide) pyrophosphoryl-undecaprenol N-acetylglucosamine transferase